MLPPFLEYQKRGRLRSLLKSTSRKGRYLRFFFAAGKKTKL